MNNVVAKIVIVAQLVFSLCFMCFAGAVYSFQAGWKNKAVVAEKKLSDLETSYNGLQQSKLDIEKSLTADVVAATQRANIADANVTQLDTSLKQAQAGLAKAEQERDKHLADLAVAQQEAEARIIESTDSRGEIKQLRDQRAQDIALRRQLEDLNLDLSGKLAVSLERSQQQLEIIGQLRGVCRANKIDPDAVIPGPIPPAVDKVDGVVKGSQKNASRSAELVQVSVGGDDGIAENMRMIVFRGADYICEIEVTDVYPDTAVGRVLEETRNGTIERGDNVTTKL